MRDNKSDRPRVLIVRNDKLGDFMLAWPALRLVKEQVPGVHVTALVRAYTRDAALMCPWIDEILLDSGPETGLGGVRQLIREMRARRFDAVLTLFSTGRIAWACWRAHIRYRLAPATKVAQLFYTHRIVQRRSRSEKPEWEYNMELAVRFLNDQGLTAALPLAPPFLSFQANDTARLRAEFCASKDIHVDARLVFVHPGSGGSAVNLTVSQYAELLAKLGSPQPLAFILTAGPGEEGRAAKLAGLLGSRPHAVFAPRGIEEFARHISFADLWISGSTGPLHIAGALDRPTAAFYPSRRSATPLRWQTLNGPERRLAFTPPSGAGETDMAAIDLDAAAAAISARFLS